MSKNRVNKAWLHSHINDPYVKRAKKEGYRARAAYKLKEIDEAKKLVKHGQVIVDLGAAPGSWSQYVRNCLAGKEGGGIHGDVIALDILPMEPVADVVFIQGDFRDDTVLARLEEALAGRKADLVLSDMAPNLSGIVDADAARMEHLIELAIDFCQMHLLPSGTLVAKCFNGPGYNEIVGLFRQVFKTVTPHKPKASRSKSSEVFLLGQGLK